MAADLAEVDRLGVGEPARARRPRGARARRRARRSRCRSAPTSAARIAIVPSAATATSLDREVRVATDQLALARAVGAHGDEHASAGRGDRLDLVDDGQDLVAARRRRPSATPSPVGERGRLVRRRAASSAASRPRDAPRQRARRTARRRVAGTSTTNSCDGPVGEVAEPVRVPADAGDVARRLGRGIQPLDASRSDPARGCAR